jgi:hypothetical protein
LVYVPRSQLVCKKHQLCTYVEVLSNDIFAWNEDFYHGMYLDMHFSFLSMKLHTLLFL